MRWLLGAGLVNNLAAIAVDSPATAAMPFDFIAPFVNAGLIGLILLMLIFRKGFVLEWQLRDAEERCRQEKEALRADNAELKQALRDGTEMNNTTILPAFIRAVDQNREYLAWLRSRGAPTPDRGPDDQ